MQKLSACRNRASPIQRFSSTRIRCMTAICPAGPPKLSAAILAQTRTASPKAIPWPAGVGDGALAVVTSTAPSAGSRGLLVGEVRIQVVEYRGAPGEALLIVGVREHDAADQPGDAGRLLAAELAILQIDVVHDLADRLERRLAKPDAT